MLAACALFAFQVGETVDVDGEKQPSDMALLGALLRVEERAVALQFAENFGEWCKAWVKSKKGRGGKGGRGRRR
jgi:hypothetical protein